MFGPIGLAIAGLGTVSGIFVARLKNRGKLKEVEAKISDIKHDNENMKPKLRHLSSLIKRSEDNYNDKLERSINWLCNVHPKDYRQWDENQRHELERLINAVYNTVQLINERI